MGASLHLKHPVALSDLKVGKAALPDFFVPRLSSTDPRSLWQEAPGWRPTHHPDGAAGAHVVVVAVPAEEVRVVPVLQDELLAAEVGVIEADPGAALHPDGVHPVHKASVLEVVTVPVDLQLPPGEVLALIEDDLERPGWRTRGQSVLSFQAWEQTPGVQHPQLNPDSQACHGRQVLNPISRVKE